MTTVVSKTIGTSGRDYSLKASWAADCPADLTAVDQVWKGLVYKDSEFSAGLSTGSPVTDATRYMWLTTGPGQARADDSGVGSTALKYDASKGAAVRLTGAYAALLHVDAPYTLIENIQWCYDSAYNYGNEIVIAAAGARLAHFIYQSNRTGNTEIACYGNCGLEDGVVILNSNSGHSGQAYYSANPGNWIWGVSFGAASDGGSFANGIYTGYSNYPQIKGCAVFGFGTPFANASSSALESVGSDYNATDGSSVPGAHSVASLTYSAQFEGTTLAALDFRAKSSGGLAPGPTGLTTTDAVGRTRGSPQTIGGWEISGGGGPPPQLLYPTSDVTTAGWSPFPGAFETVRNLLTYTEDLGNAAWSTSNASITANTTTDPLGGSAADKLVENSASFTQHYLYRTVTLAASTNHTLSVYGKAAERLGIVVEVVNRDGTTCSAKFFVEGTGISGPDTSNCTPAFSTEANGNYRCSIYFASGSGSGTPDIKVKLVGGSGSPIYNGNGTSGTHLWGIQLEVGTLTAYQPIIATDPPSTGTPTLASRMDETSADPADYAYSPNNPTTEEFEVALTVAGSPGSGQDLTADYQLRAIGLTTNFRLTLMCGATQIDQWTDTVTLADGDKTLAHTVLAANANSITNYADLRLRGRASA